jgi:hypothetical protein
LRYLIESSLRHGYRQPGTISFTHRLLDDGKPTTLELLLGFRHPPKRRTATPPVTSAETDQ